MRHNMNVTRRTLLHRTILSLPAFRLVRAQSTGANPQQQQDAILARIKAPSFPKRDFDIIKYGAKGDGKTNCTQAIHQAIAACTKAGGGRRQPAAPQLGTEVLVNRFLRSVKIAVWSACLRGRLSNLLRVNECRF